MKEAQRVWDKHEQPLELVTILEQNFVKDSDNTWRVPDPKKESDLNGTVDVGQGRKRFPRLGLRRNPRKAGWGAKRAQIRHRHKAAFFVRSRCRAFFGVA
jgi:hypothetical protein